MKLTYKDDMSIYRAHLFARDAADNFMISHWAQDKYSKDYHRSDAIDALKKLCKELGLEIRALDDAEKATEDAAAVARFRELEQEDADRDDTFAELEEMVAMPAEESAHA